MVKSQKIFVYSLIVFIALSMISGAISYTVNIAGFHILNLWKEAYMILFFFAVILTCFKQVSRSIMISFGIVATIFLIEFIYGMVTRIPLKVILYQFKLDAVLIAFGFAIFLFYKKLRGQGELKRVLHMLIDTLLIMGLVNTVFIYLQSAFSPHAVLGLLGIENFGDHHGITMISTFGHLRAFGLLKSFVASGSLMFLCFVLIRESANTLNKKSMVKHMLSAVFAIGLFLTTYKTAILALVGYFILKAIKALAKNQLRKNLITSLYAAIFVLGFITTNTKWIHAIVSQFNERISQNSILARMDQHHEIFRQFNNFIEFILGLGFGVNGTFGLNKKEMGMSPLPTDSTFIYLLSNYGFVLTLAVVSLFAIFAWKFSHQDTALQSITIYACIAFFFNNVIVNFPFNILIIIIGIGIVFLKGKEKEKENSLKEVG